MGFKEDFEKEIARAAAAVGECRVAIYKRSMSKADADHFEMALGSGVSKERIKSALSQDTSIDISIGDATIQKHRTRVCTCFKSDGPLYEDGKK